MKQDALSRFMELPDKEKISIIEEAGRMANTAQRMMMAERDKS